MSVSPRPRHKEADLESGSQDQSPFETELAEINKALEEYLGSPVPVLKSLAGYAVLGHGKRLRPLLYVLSARTCGRDDRDLFRSSVIFEVMHAASLLHDDVIDNAELRRNKPSAGKVWGNQLAVLGGDFLYAKSSEMAVACGNLRFLEVLTNATIRMTEGQVLELTHTNNWSLTRDEYMEIITAKTAVLISAACACGAIMAGAGERETDCLAQFGLNLGIAFQIQDDLLDYTSTSEAFGKPVGKDLLEGKVTLPLILTLGGMDRGEAAELEERFKAGKAGNDDYQSLIRRVRKGSSLEETRAEVKCHVERAAEYLAPLPQVKARQDLLALNQQLLDRAF